MRRGPSRLACVTAAALFGATPAAQANADGTGTLGSSDRGVMAGSLSPSNPSGTNLGPPPVVVAPQSSTPNVTVTSDAAPVTAPVAITSTPEALPQPRVFYQRRYNLAIVGASVLIASWGADRLLTQDLPTPVSGLQWVPLVGPWALLYSQTQTAAPNSATMGLLVVDGLLQATGLTLGILGFVLHKKRMLVSLPAVPQVQPVNP